MPLASRIALVAAVAVISLINRGLIAQAPPRPDFNAATASVLVDVVVRGPHGAAINDLTARDFNVLEEGVPQTVDAFHVVRPGDGAPAPAVVALAFDPLSSEGLALAVKSVDAYLGTVKTMDFTGVFRLGGSVDVVQPFTTDAEAVRQAVRSMLKTARARTASGAQANTTGQQGSGGMRLASMTIEFERTLTVEGVVVEHQSVLNHREWMESTESDVAGLQARVDRGQAQFDQLAAADTLSGLLAMIDSLSDIPGRKTLVYFTEGADITNERAQHYRESIVATANRANVTLYTIDSAGLRTHSAGEDMAAHLADQSKYESGVLERDSTRAWTRDLERNEQLVQGNAATFMSVLAERTGGFVVSDTNDLRKGLSEIEADRHSYYLLRYTPRNTDFRGEFRRIAVTVPGRDAVVRSRTGYVAVKAAGPGPLLSHEAPALAVLGSGVLATDIPVHGAALSMPRADAIGRVAVLVAVAPGSATYVADRTSYRSDFTIVGLIRSGAGDAIDKVSQRYQLTGPVSKMEEAQRGGVLFFRHRDLPQGVYTLDYVIYDALTKKAGAGRSVPFEVAGPDDTAPAVGSLMVLNRAQPIAETKQDDSNPMVWNDLVLYPNVGEPIRRSTSKTVSFFLPIVSRSVADLSASLELFKDGQVAGATPLAVPKPDGAGKLAVMGQLPIEGFPPGEYLLKATIRHGASSEVREARFTVTN